jgi:hypothetical protein
LGSLGESFGFSRVTFRDSWDAGRFLQGYLSRLLGCPSGMPSVSPGFCWHRDRVLLGSGWMSRLKGTLVVALLLLVAAELTLHFFGPRLGEPQFWYAPDAQVIVEGMDRLERAGVTSDLVLVGSSMVEYGLIPSMFEGGLGSIDAAHNVGIPKGYTTVVQRWLLDEVVPRLAPKRVIWGLSSIDFNGGRPTPALAEYEAARAGALGFFGAADRVLWTTSMISRYRDLLREPSDWVTILDARSGDAVAALDDLLEPTVWPDVRRTPKTLADLKSSLLFDFRVGSEHAASFEATIGSLQTAGTDVVIVLLPVSAPYIDAHPGGEQGYLEFVGWLADTTVELGVPFLQYDRMIPDEEYLDYNHITPSGARMLTGALIADLEDLGW